MTTILAISGSLRGASVNSALIQALRRVAPAGIEVSIYDRLDHLPFFNPDQDLDAPSSAVGHFRAALNACDAVVISCPEYAHGVPGVVKNALDWVVGSGEFVGKPVAVLNASARATHAWNSLLETLTVMSARVVPEASITLPLDGSKLTADGIASDPRWSMVLATTLRVLAGSVRRDPE
jgi:NAD(P)H-dependent FMN reductase